MPGASILSRHKGLAAPSHSVPLPFRSLSDSDKIAVVMETRRNSVLREGVKASATVPHHTAISHRHCSTSCPCPPVKRSLEGEKAETSFFLLLRRQSTKACRPVTRQNAAFWTRSSPYTHKPTTALLTMLYRHSASSQDFKIDEIGAYEVPPLGEELLTGCWRKSIFFRDVATDR